MLLGKSREILQKGWAIVEMIPVVDVCGGESKVQCYKEQYDTGTWNGRSIVVQLLRRV